LIVEPLPDVTVHAKLTTIVLAPLIPLLIATTLS
jgi:hypothetical protein